MLGPLLFVIFINDIDKVVFNRESDLSKFADDTKIFKTIETGKDTMAMQKSLNSLVTWSQFWDCLLYTSDAADD